MDIKDKNPILDGMLVKVPEHLHHLSGRVLLLVADLFYPKQKYISEIRFKELEPHSI